MVPVMATSDAVTVMFPPLLASEPVPLRVKRPPSLFVSALKTMNNSMELELIGALMVIPPVAKRVSVVALSRVLAIALFTPMVYSAPVPVWIVTLVPRFSAFTISAACTFEGSVGAVNTRGLFPETLAVVVVPLMVIDPGSSNH